MVYNILNCKLDFEKLNRLLFIPKGKRFKKDLELFPEQIYALIIDQLAENASQSLAIVSQNPNAVIAVPTNFNYSQRRATKDAAKIAGLNPIAIIPEPIAACIAYKQISERKAHPEHILVYNFGGETLDVSIVKIENGVFTVLGNVVDSSFGGKDFDRLMRDYLVEQIEEKGFFLDPDDEQDKRDLARLLLLAEEKKINLSSAKRDKLFFTHTRKGKDIEITVTQSIMEKFVDDMKYQLLNPIELVLQQTGFQPKNIDRILMVGGSSRIPKVQELVCRSLKQQISNLINPDEAIAFGASIYGAYQLGAKIKNLPNIKIQEVTPMSIGVKTLITYSEVIPKNTPIPCSSSFIPFITLKNGTGIINIAVCERDENINFRIGSFTLKYLPNTNCRVWIKLAVDMKKITIFA